MKYKFHIPFGARIFKTGLAVGLALYFATLLEIEPKIFAAVSALINVQPSVHRSFRNAGEQVLTHVISVSLALSFGYLIGSGPIEMAVVTILVITINKKLGLTQSIVMGVVAALFVLDAPRQEFLSHAISRSYVIFLGLGVALLVNALIAPPNYREKLIEVLKILNDKTASFFEQTVNNFIKLNLLERSKFNENREEIKELLRQSRNYLELYKEQLGKYAENHQDVLMFERYIDYNANLYHSSRDTYIATDQRFLWRAEQGNPPVSVEFQQILVMLERGLITFSDLNKQLYNHVLLNKPLSHIPINESFWEELSLYVDRWHIKLTGADFLHAFMYVSSVANDIKLACRGIKEFIKDLENS